MQTQIGRPKYRLWKPTRDNFARLIENRHY